MRTERAQRVEIAVGVDPSVGISDPVSALLLSSGPRIVNTVVYYNYHWALTPSVAEN
jgi:hypothetical protein